MACVTLANFDVVFSNPFLMMNYRASWLLVFCLLIAGGMQAQSQDNIWSLQECLEYARDHNLDLHRAALGLRTSEINLLQTQAARYPNLNINPSFNASVGRSIDPTLNTFITDEFYSFNFTVASGITAFNAGRLINSTKQARLDLRASEKDLKQQEMDLALNITLAYLQILFNDELLKSAEFQLASTKEQAERTNKLVQAGSLAPADLLQLRSQIATEELNVVNAQNQLELAYLNLMQQLQLDPAEPFGIKKPELEEPEENLLSTPAAEIYQTAEANQPFIESADIRIKSAEYDILIAKADYYPSLTVGANAFTAWSSGRRIQTSTQVVNDTFPLIVNDQPVEVVSANPIPVFGTYNFVDQLVDNQNFGLGFRLNIPIYNRRQVKSNVERSQIGLERARIDAQIARQSLQQTIQQAYQDAKSAYSSYLSTQRQIDALDLTLENTQKQFDLGMVNSVDFLIAKNNLNRANNDLVRSKYNYIFRTKVLDFYLGNPIGF